MIVRVMLELSETEWLKLRPRLEEAVDEDATVGLRLKNLDTAPEYELAPQVVANVLAFEDEES